MSPIPPPPPAGVFVPSDDWTDDPSFDLSPSASHFALPPSPSSSSSKSRHSLSSVRSHASSPLRHSISKAPIPIEDDEGEEDGFDLPDSFPAMPSRGPSLVMPQQRDRSSTAGSSSSRISATVVGQGPQGIGTITKLGSGTLKSGKVLNFLPTDTIRAKLKATEMTWEADLDFDSGAPSLPTGASLPNMRRLTLSPPKRRVMPDADALDDLGFDLDDEDNEATLKAGATLKALLPPKRIPTQPTIKARPAKAPTPPTQDDLDLDLETDLVLPLNLTNLTLATQSQSHPKPRVSNASTATDWDSPSTSSPHSGKKSGTWSWEDSSPGRNRLSETSHTSVSLHSDHAPEKEDTGLAEADEDIESGLVLPSSGFFANTKSRAKELNAILDMKRKPQFAPPSAHRRTGTDETWRTGEDSFEDGLVFDNPRVDLSRHRLSKSRTARATQSGIPFPPSSSVKRKPGQTPQQPLSKGSWERWKAPPPPPLASTGSREKTQSTSSLGLTGLRSQSYQITNTLKEPISAWRRPESPHIPVRELDATPKARLPSTDSQARSSMLPPPVPPPAPTPGPSRLRHQKSHFHLPPQSPSLSRKQSLSSLQDALVRPPAAPEVPGLPLGMPESVSSQSLTSNASSGGGQGRYHHSTSRLTMPTTSSRAKIRPPVQGIFPRQGSDTPLRPSAPRTRMMEMPKRLKAWGDGTELEGIEDLQVEDEPSSSRTTGIGLGRPGRRGYEAAKDPNRPGSSGRTTDPAAGEKRKKSQSGSGRKKGQRRPALLIKHLGAVDKKKVVGDMVWNPATLRWEGNESILRDFDTVVSSSARPALITHYTGGSTTSLAGLNSPVAGGTSSNNGASSSGTVRIVGDMRFDPEKMCWVSLVDEDDPFEGMLGDADDEEDGVPTITRKEGRRLMAVGGHGHGAMGASQSSGWSRMTSESSATSSSMSTVAGGGAAGIHERLYEGYEVPPELVVECREADERHRREMKGWRGVGAGVGGRGEVEGERERRERERREEKRLWEIRNLAMKS